MEMDGRTFPLESDLCGAAEPVGLNSDPWPTDQRVSVIISKGELCNEMLIWE